MRDIYKGLIPHVSNVVWVIAGREKLKWDIIESEWQDSLEQHLIGDLSLEDTVFFLDKAGINDKLIQKQIYKVTNGTPIYLDLCVDNYYALVRNNIAPNIDDIGETSIDLVSRFIQYLDTTTQELIEILSCIEDWDNECFDKCCEEIDGSIDSIMKERILNLSFIQTQDNISYKMHKTIKEILYDNCPIYRKQTAMSLYNEQLKKQTTFYGK